MGELLTPSDIEALAAKAGKSIAQVCRDARVAQSTFSRWKRGATEPTLDVYRRIRDAAAASLPPADHGAVHITLDVIEAAHDPAPPATKVA